MPDLDSARAWYSGFDPVHGFDHIKRVYLTAKKIAIAEGADVEIVCAAALLHDVNPEKRNPENNKSRDDHQNISADFARHYLANEGWSKDRITEVEHCIRAHRFRDTSEKPKTVEAKVLFDADKLDAIGAIGAARAIAYASRKNQPIYMQPSNLFLVSNIKEPGEKHSAYHEYLKKLSKLKSLIYTEAAMQIADDRHQFMVKFFLRLQAEALGEC